MGLIPFLSPISIVKQRCPVNCIRTQTTSAPTRSALSPTSLATSSTSPPNTNTVSPIRHLNFKLNSSERFQLSNLVTLPCVMTPQSPISLVMLTRGGERSADVLCWAGFAENTLLPSVAQWVWPALSIVQPNKAHMNDAKANLKAAFGFINDVLSKQTFLVGERITYADISCCLTLKSAFENVLTAEFRSGFPHVTRWFNTVMNQPGVKSVVGDVTMCEKEAHV